MALGIQLKDVTKKIGGSTIIDQLSLDIHKGEVFGLLGPNGAGKTTTIRMIVGLMAITSGDILIDGISISKERSATAHKLGAIVENPDFYLYMSGLDNLRYFAKLQDKKISRKTIDDVVRVVGLTESIQKKVKTYSLGMKQRLGLAQSLLHRPKVLILDEPTNGLDPAGIREFREYIRRLASEQNMTIIISSHLLSEIELMCDRVAIIQNGRLIRTETIKERPDKENFEKPASQVVIELADSKNAEQLLHQKLPSLETRRSGEQLYIQADKEMTAKVIQLLATESHAIYRVRDGQQTLEDRFLEITNEKGEAYADAHSQ
ncbi:ATP-binding cassette domain-containing protein [Sediminibacillus dalangtanensis]|uniref:ATP-binding cassette domain-containing protein n=1 Tax=Sediminibacillus dalangtanensis TaxID=2729421 RepID=A0ABX7VPR2_9BACI|nr:ABC transporter ATP-binding protein [Sediminibacillus dalangtanensis]QTM98917.1 ATP-binding cassette domain-containing protein [Sediminibacillus dalangtanensis]